MSDAQKNKVYIAGRIMGASLELLEWHGRLGLAFRGAGWDTYVPHIDEPAVSPECFKWDLQQMAESDLLVASLFEPSTGTGVELALFQGPALILYEGEVSPMIKGLVKARSWSIMQPVRDAARVVRVAAILLGRY